MTSSKIDRNPHSSARSKPVYRRRPRLIETLLTRAVALVAPINPDRHRLNIRLILFLNLCNVALCARLIQALLALWLSIPVLMSIAV